MNPNRFRPSQAVLALFCLSSALVHAQATLYGVGDLPGGIFFSQVRDATKAGGVIYAVGGVSANTGSTGLDTGFLWTSTGGIVAIPNLAVNTTATNAVISSAITPDAQFIASRSRMSSSSGLRQAVRVTTSGLAATLLGNQPGFNGFSVANAISADGSVLYGFATPNSTSLTQPVRYTVAGPTMTAIPFLNAGDNNSSPTGRGSSADGSVVVGTSTNTVTSAGRFYGPGNAAFRYLHGTGISAIPYLAGGTWNMAAALSPDGNLTLVAGDSTAHPFNGELYIHNAATTARTPLGTPAAGWETGNLSGMSADGAVVVANFGARFAPQSASFLHNANGWHDLQKALAAAGANVTGWQLGVVGMSPDATLVWGDGTHNGNTEGWVAELPAGYLASYASPPQPPSIVGAWIVGDPTQDGAGVVTFLNNGYYFYVEKGEAAALPTGFTGMERGKYTWNPATNAFTVTTLVDTNGDLGLDTSNGVAGITISVLGDYLTFTPPNGPGGDPATLVRISGSSPIVGSWLVDNVTKADSSTLITFLADGHYYLASDGSPIIDPTGQDGMELGTYTWNEGTGAFSATIIVDTNGQWGLSHPQGTWTVTVVGDKLFVTDNSGTSIGYRVKDAPKNVAAPDFNRDGRPDLLWRNGLGNTYAWYMNGPALDTDAFVASIDPSWKIDGVADFNGDGKPDLVWRNGAGNTYVWYMDGPNFLSDAFLFSLPPEWVIQGVADFNADGHPDFLMRNTITGNAFVWFFNNAAAIGDQFLFNIDPSWKVEGVADFNGDGQPDLLFRNSVSGLSFAWDTQFSASTLSLAGSSPPIYSIAPVWEVVQVADWNGDGQPDLVFRNAATGVVFVWYLDGVSLQGSDFIIQIDPSWEIVPRR